LKRSYSTPPALTILPLAQMPALTGPRVI
jgi:hypothetical protein